MSEHSKTWDEKERSMDKVNCGVGYILQSVLLGFLKSKYGERSPISVDLGSPNPHFYSDDKHLELALNSIELAFNMYQKGRIKRESADFIIETFLENSDIEYDNQMAKFLGSAFDLIDSDNKRRSG